MIADDTDAGTSLQAIHDPSILSIHGAACIWRARRESSRLAFLRARLSHSVMRVINKVMLPASTAVQPPPLLHAADGTQFRREIHNFYSSIMVEPNREAISKQRSKKCMQT